MFLNNLLQKFLSTLIWGPIIGLLIIVFLYLIGITKFWKVRGVEYVKPHLLFGNFYNVLVSKENFMINVKRLYDTISGPFGGIFLLTQPVLIARDPELIKRILHTEADKFTDSIVLTNNLMLLKVVRWYGIMKSIPAIFSSNMRKHKFDILKKRCTELQEHVEREIISNSVLDAREIITRFSTAMTASTLFSIEIDSLNNRDDTLCKIGRLIATFQQFGQLRSVLSMAVPFVMEYFNIGAIDPKLEKMFRDITEQTLMLRETGKVVEFDYMQLIVQIRNCDQLSDDGKCSINAINKNKYITNDQVFTRAFIFFVFVFHTASSTVSFALLELAKNKQIQKRLQSEIDQALESRTKITNDSIQTMSYLELVVSETLRKYPAFPLVVKSIVEPFKITNTDIVLDKDQVVCIPVYAIHHDPKYYPRPDEFNPDRFTSDEIKKRAPDTYCPYWNLDSAAFRISVALIQAKMAIVAICSKFDLDLAPGHGPDNVAENFNLRFTKRNVK